MSFLAFMIGSSVWAANGSKTLDVVDPGWGKFTIKVEHEGKPSRDPIRVDLSVLCKDQRTTKSLTAPIPEELMKHDKICAFDKYLFDKENKILTLQFTTSEDESGECKMHWKQNFEMKKICALWTPSKVLN